MVLTSIMSLELAKSLNCTKKAMAGIISVSTLKVFAALQVLQMEFKSTLLRMIINGLKNQWKTSRDHIARKSAKGILIRSQVKNSLIKYMIRHFRFLKAHNFNTRLCFKQTRIAKIMIKLKA